MTASTFDASELARHQPYLMKFALRQLRNRAEAEDAVQETLAAAIQGADRFSGGSSVRTWLVSILKHKIVDCIRRASRERLREDVESELSLEETDALFAPDGHYAEPPQDWGRPDEALSRREFFEVLERCMERLPRNTARAFMLREVMGLETEEICRECGISSSNCWVMLYRARMTLRVCMEELWFAKG